MPVPVVDERTFVNEVVRSEIPVLVDFFTDWCAPCKTVAPEVEAVANELAGKVKVVKIDLDRAPMLKQQLRIQSVPTFVVFVRGRVAEVRPGAMRRDALKAMLEPFLPRAEGSIMAKELAALIAQGQVVPVDIREAAVYRRAHLPGAVHMAEEEIPNRLAELHMLPGAPILYCRSGDRSKTLVESLTAQGVEAAFLEGGVLAWEAEGFPIERPDLCLNAPRC